MYFDLNIYMTCVVW